MLLTCPSCKCCLASSTVGSFTRQGARLKFLHAPQVQRSASPPGSPTQTFLGSMPLGLATYTIQSTATIRERS